jgi:hypothetical protein
MKRLHRHDLCGLDAHAEMTAPLEPARRAARHLPPYPTRVAGFPFTKAHPAPRSHAASAVTANVGRHARSPLRRERRCADVSSSPGSGLRMGRHYSDHVYVPQEESSGWCWQSKRFCNRRAANHRAEPGVIDLLVARQGVSRKVALMPYALDLSRLQASPRRAAARWDRRAMDPRSDLLSPNREKGLTTCSGPSHRFAVGIRPRVFVGDGPLRPNSSESQAAWACETSALPRLAR